MPAKKNIFIVFPILFVIVMATSANSAQAASVSKGRDVSASALSLNTIFPTTKIAGDGSFTLTLTGDEFDINSIVLWNGTDLATTFVDATQLTASVPAAYILNEGTAQVAVRNGPPGGGVTASVLFTIIKPSDNTWMAHSPEGGWISELVIAPTNPSILYAGTAHSGIFKSVDGGDSWSAINNGISASSVNSLAVDPSNPSVLLAGVSGGGLYRSTNGGAFWSLVLQTWPEDVAFDPQNPQIVYAGAGPLYKSSDGGVNWAALGQDFSDGGGVHEIVLDPVHAGTLYVKVIDKNVVWKSTDYGENWSEENNGLPAELGLKSLAISPSAPNILYAGTKYSASLTDQVGLYKSEDSGESWTRVSSQAADYLKIAVDPQDSNILYLATSAGVLKSDDGGVILGSVLNQLAFTVVIDPVSPAVVYAAGIKDIYRSDNAGENWRSIHNKLYAQLITTLIYDPQNISTLFAGTHTGGIWKSSDSGINWEQLSPDPIYVNQLTIDPHNSNHLYYAGNGVVESQDGGLTWGSYLAGSAITFAPNSDLYMGFEDGVQKSTDGGVTWLDKSNGLPADNSVMGLVVDPQDPNVVYAFNRTDLYKSVDGGDNWALIKNNPTSLSWLSCYLYGRSCLAIDPVNTSTLYLIEGLTQAPLFSKSVDGGLTWTAIDTNLGYIEMNAVVVDPTYDTVVYLGTENGAFISKDAGQSWEGFNSGLGSPLVRALVALPAQPAPSGPMADIHTTSTASMKFSIAGGTVYAYAGNPILPTFKTTGSYDGWILESAKTSNKGGAINATAQTFLLGDDALDRQYKAILSFNTADLPNNATVTSARLRIKPSGKPSGGNPFNLLGGLLVDIRKGAFGKTGLQASDFQAALTAKKVGIFGKSLVGGWYSVTLNLAGRNNINKAGVTQFRLYFTKGDNNDHGADFMRFFSGNSATNKPELIITYTVP